MTSTPYRVEKYRRPGEKERILRNNRAMRIRNRDWLRSIKEDRGCERCGFPDVRALEFHHRDPKEKKFRLSNQLNRSRASLEAEVDKCMVLCANCHAIEHFSS